jgi:hypothetical protein
MSRSQKINSAKPTISKNSDTSSGPYLSGTAADVTGVNRRGAPTAY